MLKKTFLYNIRSPIKYTALILIFSITFLALCFVVNYDKYVQTNILDINKSFTTIAVPDTQVIDKYLPDPYQKEDGNLTINYMPEADFYLSLRHFVDASVNGRLDSCELLRGVCSNVTPVLSGAFDPLEYNADIDSPRNSAAFIVTTLDIGYLPKTILDNGIVNSGGASDDSAHYVIKFKVDKAIVLNECYKTPEFIYAFAGAFTEDLQCPFEYGKQYFISGLYYSTRVIQKERDNGTPFPDTYLTLDENSVPSIYLDGTTDIIISGEESLVIKDFEVSGEATTAYTYSSKELSQMCVAYNGDLNSLLLERPDIAQRLESTKVNANSFEIRTTNNLNSVLYFNQGKATVIAGHSFTEAEISSGASVCIVNERFAALNNLKVGDSFNIDIYDTKMWRSNGGAWMMAPYNNSVDKEKLHGSLELKVIGIYNTPPWEYNAYSLNYNTVFIPSNAVPIKFDMILPQKTEDLEKSERLYFSMYSHHMIASLFSVIIPNDKIDEFKTEADVEGFGNYFIYNDQGYSQIKDTLPLIAQSTRVFLIAACIGFISVFVLYLTLLPRKRHELGMLISLGAKSFDAAMSAVFEWLLIIIPALLLSLIATFLSYAPLAKAALGSTMKQLQYNNAYSVGMQEKPIVLSQKFSRWNSDYITILVILSAILILYLITAMGFYIWQSKQPILKLLRRKE